MSTIWFSSDPHFHHKNIIEYGERPFSDVAEMNEYIVDTHNKFVKPPDHWYCLGDVTMERDNQGRGLGIVTRMNGHKRLILGNHDHYAMKHYLLVFEKVMAMNVLDRIRFTHIPIHPLSMGGCIANVHGHIHQRKSPDPVLQVTDKGQVLVKPYVNISLEVTNYRPVSLEEVKEMVKKAASRAEGAQSWSM